MEKANNNGETALHLAIDHDFGYGYGAGTSDRRTRDHRLDLVRYLLEQGADRDKANSRGQTPLHLAAAHWTGLETAKLLMVYGADLNARNYIGQLPIDRARTEEIKQAILDEPRRRISERPRKTGTLMPPHLLMHSRRKRKEWGEIFRSTNYRVSRREKPNRARLQKKTRTVSLVVVRMILKV